MALTQEELDQILNAIKASSQDLKSLAVISNLDGLNSLPAIKGDSLVLVPLDLIQSKSANITVVAEDNDKLTLRTHGFELQDGDELCLLRYIKSRGRNILYDEEYKVNKKGWIRTNSSTFSLSLPEEETPYISLPFERTPVYETRESYSKYVIKLSPREILRSRVDIAGSTVSIRHGKHRRDIPIGDETFGIGSVIYGIAVYRNETRISNIAPFKVMVDARDSRNICFIYSNLPQ